MNENTETQENTTSMQLNKLKEMKLKLLELEAKQKDWNVILIFFLACGVIFFLFIMLSGYTGWVKLGLEIALFQSILFNVGVFIFTIFMKIVLSYRIDYKKEDIGIYEKELKEKGMSIDYSVLLKNDETSSDLTENKNSKKTIILAVVIGAILLVITIAVSIYIFKQ